MINQKSRYRRAHGITLIEMVTSLSIISVLLLGLSGAVMIGAHAIPSATDTGIVDQSVIHAINDIRSDFREATQIEPMTMGWGQTFALNIKDSGADGTPSRIVYTYTTSSKTLSRKVDSLDTVVVLSGVQVFVFTTIKENTKGRVAYLLMLIDDTIQGIFEDYFVLPYKPEVW